MKRTYEKFSEIADAFVNGDSWPHKLSDHEDAECLGWQKGVRQFAKWLDTAGVQIVANPEIYDALWKIKGWPDRIKTTDQ